MTSMSTLIQTSLNTTLGESSDHHHHHHHHHHTSATTNTAASAAEQALIALSDTAGGFAGDSAAAVQGEGAAVESNNAPMDPLVKKEMPTSVVQWLREEENDPDDADFDENQIEVH